MNNNYIYILLLFSHFLGDWIFQSREIAENKSKNFCVLLKHLLYVHLTLFPICFYIFNFDIVNTLFVLFFNAILHGIIDWNIWKKYPIIIKTLLLKKFSKEETDIKMQNFIEYNLYAKDYTFYTFIAVDQFLHLSILFYLFGK
jgi:hypothetical protein